MPGAEGGGNGLLVLIGYWDSWQLSPKMLNLFHSSGQGLPSLSVENWVVTVAIWEDNRIGRNELKSNSIIKLAIWL